MSASLDEVEVLERNRAFYTAFRRRDMATMESLWARSAKVACVHPGWQPIRGRGEVMASLSAILGQPQVPQIRCEDVSVHVVGDAAFVVCEEVLREGRLVATNVFVREEGDWRLLHHQAGPMAPDAESDAGELSDDLAGDLADLAGDDTGDELDLGTFTSGPLAMGRRPHRAVSTDLVGDRSDDLANDLADDLAGDLADDLVGTGADRRARAAGARLSAGELGDASFDDASAEDEIDDDEALGPGPLFHSPSDEPLSDPGPVDELGAEPGDDEDEDATDGARSAPALGTRPIGDIGDLGGSFRRSARPVRRLVN